MGEEANLRDCPVAVKRSLLAIRKPCCDNGLRAKQGVQAADTPICLGRPKPRSGEGLVKVDSTPVRLVENLSETSKFLLPTRVSEEARRPVEFG